MAKHPRIAPPEAAELEQEYRFVREIGRGGTGVVYLATDRELGRSVAIKLIQPSLTSDEETLQRFTREARTAAVLHHPNIVAVHAVKRLRNGTLAMVLQYVPGGTLKDLIRREAPLAVPVVERLLLDIASALAYAHDRGIVHRDVKPENIFLDQSGGAALLADFGIARTPDPSGNHTLAGMAIGTPAYMSPEQIDGGEVDGRADLYSLALVGWEMLTGDTPWEGESLYSIIYKQKHEQLPPLRTYRSDVPPQLQHVIRVGLRKDPQQRFADAGGLIAALEAVHSANPWQRCKQWLATRRMRVESPAPAPPPPPEVRLAAVDASSLPVEPSSDATVRFRRASEETEEQSENALFSAAEQAAVENRGTDLPAQPVPHSPPPPEVRQESDVSPPAIPLRSTMQPRTAHMLRYAAAAASLLLITGLGATLYAVTQQGPGAALEASTSSSAAGSAAGHTGTNSSEAHAHELGGVGAGGSSALLSGTPLLDLWHGAESGFDSLIRPGSFSPTPEAPDAEKAVPSPAAPPPADSVAAEPRPDPVAPVATTPEEPAAAPERPSTTAPAASSPRTTSIATGGLHSCMLTSAGNALCWGGNGEGQAGIGGTSRVVSASPISSASRFREIAAGVAHTCGILTSGEAVCWGSNRSGQLGDGTTSGRSQPVPVHGGRRFSAVHPARSHTCGLTRQGELFCWGENTHGQLGNGTTLPSTTPVRSASGPFTQVALGWNHTCALDRSGQAFCWGTNADGQLGTGSADQSTAPTPVSESTRFSSVVAGAAHSCALTSNGTAFCWGRNSNGQLGTGGTASQRSPSRVEAGVSFVALSAGSTHTCGLTRSGEIFCWGRNAYGQLGDGTTTDRPVPVRVAASARFSRVQASGAHTCALTTAGDQFCWGYNVEGQLGDGTRNHRSRPVRVTPAAG